MANRLLGGHPDGHYNARVNWDPIPGPDGVMLGFNVPNGFSTYAEAYKLAADTLIDKMAASTYHVNLLVYPAVFCYRQYLELRLKELIATASELLDQNAARPNNHDLRTLWRLVRPLLSRVWSDNDTSARLDEIARVIEDFSDLDPGSCAFRYPVDTDGGPSLAAITLGYVNAKQISEVIAGISGFLDGASYGIEEMLDSERQLAGGMYQTDKGT